MEAPAAPLVTVITPAYNQAKFLPETIDSILSNGYAPIEFIVLDDGSRDKTRAVLESYRDRLTIVSHANMGETRTVNKGIAMARGAFVMTVNADDPLRPGAIGKLAAALVAQPEALLAYPDWESIDDAGKLLETVNLPDYTLTSLFHPSYSIALGPGVMIRRAAFERVGYRDPRLRYASDIDLWARMALAGPFAHVPEVLATHRVHGEAASTAHRGWRLAWEVPLVARRALARPGTPAELLAARRSILANAHGAAIMLYAGRHLRARLAHAAALAWYTGSLSRARRLLRATSIRRQPAPVQSNR
ncbi:glycosyltransferase [Starkeya koreensis]|uniref:Glycosyltransferase n=1 Tax=Ancylobacter koreensis TaxID=266121 RepID=A0ABT0DLK5_9HYPH|nr:glycosyltransferase [Ancylobacter koreensis]MCK0208161.1 glycosyltransferase [Ancylobacter koreensis]